MNRTIPLRIAALTLAGCAMSCGSTVGDPKPQWLVAVSTDAPVPQIGNRLLVELLNDKGEIACTQCRLDAVAASPSVWDFGVEATASAVLLRVRLYRGDHVGPDGQPIPSTTIDQMGRLPPAGEGITRVGMHLVLDCVSHPSDPIALTTCVGPNAYASALPILAAPVDHGAPKREGSSPYLEKIRRDCPPVESIPEEMACVPGSLFFLGDSLAPAPHTDVTAASSPERLVGVGSFLMDKHEVTVRSFFSQFPELKAAVKTKCPSGLACRSTPSTPPAVRDYCNVTVGAPASTESELPMNCVNWTMASDYCQKLGKRLPTEAEWELAASNSSLETRFPWGNESPTCAMTNVARGIKENNGVDDISCREPPQQMSKGTLASADFAVNPVSQIPYDAAKPWASGPPSQIIVGLAGNVSEWTTDYYVPYGMEPTPCANDKVEGTTQRAGVLILEAPTKDASTAYCGRLVNIPNAPTYTVKGGSFRSPVESTWNAVRTHEARQPAIASPGIGFRCVKDL